LLILAAVGTPIARAKYGDKEIEFARRRGRAIAEAVKDESEGVTAQAVEILEKVDPIAAVEVLKAQASARAAAHAYTLRLEASIREILSDDGHIRMEDRDRGLDYFVETSEKLIGIEVKFRRNGRPFATDVVNQAIGYLHSSTIDKILVISNAYPTRQAMQIAEQEPGVSVVLWRGPEDDAALVKGDTPGQRGLMQICTSPLSGRATLAPEQAGSRGDSRGLTNHST
jgi:hypothetical protein